MLTVVIIAQLEEVWLMLDIETGRLIIFVTTLSNVWHMLPKCS